MLTRLTVGLDLLLFSVHINIKSLCCTVETFPGGSAVNNLPSNAGIWVQSWVRKIPQGGKWLPTQYS